MNLGMFRQQAAAKFLRTDAPGALITVAPPWSVTIFAVMALALLGLLLIAGVGHVQLVASGRGVVRPDQPPLVLHAPFTGVVLSVARKRGDLGHAGDLLLTLDARAEQATHDRCVGEVAVEQQELTALQQRLADWNQAVGPSHDASMALVLITQIRAQREKTAADALRCETLGAIVARSRVTYPLDAVIADLAVTRGAQVHEGDVLMTLIPASARLVGYLSLPEQYRNEVAVAQRVNVKFDALPYDEVGTGSARIARLLDALPSGAKIEGHDGTGVITELELDAMPRGSGPPRPGMTFTGDVKTRRVRILSLLFGAAATQE